jgi:hypothetical protein
MGQVTTGFLRACCLGLSAAVTLIVSVGPSAAGVTGPAPLVGVTGPVGLLVAGTAYGGYLLFKHFKNRA